MPAKMIDGKAIAAKLQKQIADQVAQLQKQHGIQPGLAAVLVGDHEPSKVYVRNKRLACDKVGFFSEEHLLPATTSQPDLLRLIATLNGNPKIHGILIQLPLPSRFKAEAILDTVDPAKDVDGFHPINMGQLLLGRPRTIPCTPYGILKLLEEIDCHLEGKDVVIVGRGNLVGKPLAILLTLRHATVTVCHTKTMELADKVAHADIVVAAMGRARALKGDWIKPGAVVIDAGTNKGPDGKLVGDVDFASAAERAAWITPVPGGVGPMTITMLLWNTLEAAKRSFAE